MKAVHKTTNEIRAVKLFRDDPAYRRASKKEIEILKLLSDRDPENHQSVSIACPTSDAGWTDMC